MFSVHDIKEGIKNMACSFVRSNERENRPHHKIYMESCILVSLSLSVSDEWSFVHDGRETDDL